MNEIFSKLRTRTAAVAAALVVVLLAGLSAARATLDNDRQTSVTATTSETPTSSSEGSVDTLLRGGGGGAVNNEVVVLNVTDGRFANRSGFGIARVTGGDVTNTNSAAATSSCSDCRTVAVAVQAVLVMGDSNYIAPTNQAVAINTECTRCHSYALAYQYVVTTGGIVRFTPEGEQRLSELEAQIRELSATELPFLELEAKIDALVEQMWVVVDEEVVKVGLNPKGTAAKDSDMANNGGGTSSPSPSDSRSPTPTATSTESEAASRTPTATASTTASPSVTATASPSPSPE